MSALRVLIAGAGFAGSILARALHRQGHVVTLVDRARHPRFALGESATPLAAIALERLAARYDLPDLDALAAHGRWLAALPELRRGLKRGFTFYTHRRGQPWRNDEDNSRRLLVAASPHDAVADSHWLRADVDAWLTRRAEAEGVEVHEGVTLHGLARQRGEWRASARGEDGATRHLAADLVVDATGAGGLLAGALELRPAPPRRMPATLLLGGHFAGVGDFAAAAARRGEPLPGGPYADERAAVHHLLAEGWLYLLRFDHGVASAGVVLRHDRVSRAFRRRAARSPAAAWGELLDRYPSLAELFAPATTEVGILHAPRLPRRWSRAAGEGWAMLPHAYCFLSPLFSTGIAWSLLGVERLALLLEGVVARRTRQLPVDALDRYDARLRSESTHLAALVGGAYDLLAHGELFFAYALLYFAAASFAEARQRLLAPPPALGQWAWDGLLGADDPTLRRALRAARAGGDAARASGGAAAAAVFAGTMRALVAARDVAGLAAEGARNLYPADLEALRRGAHRLGLEPAELERRLPRLRLPAEREATAITPFRAPGPR